MICSVIQNKDLDAIFEILDDGQVEMAEIRLDRCPLSEDDIDQLFSSSTVPLIATCRVAETGDATLSEKRLSLAIEAGAAYADLEIEAPTQMGKRLRRLCSDRGTVFIRSFHDFEGTPSREDLTQMVRSCHRYGGDIAKIVTTPLCAEDVERVLSLYDGQKEGSITAFCMGELGKESRVKALGLGAPFSYAALSEGEEAAPGQIDTAHMRTMVYGEGYEPFVLRTDIPCSKSFSQRAIIMAALAEGTSHLSGYSPCKDSEGAIKVAQALGACVEREDDTLVITGIGPVTSPLALERLNVCESGLLTRMMIPVLAALNGADCVVEGEGTLLRRPLAGAAGIMASYGVRLSNEAEHDGKEVFVPLKISGNLIPGRAEVSGKGSSQLISGLLMALPLCDGESVLYVTEPKSIPYMFITVDVLAKFGVKLVSEMEGDDEFVQTQNWDFCTGINFKIAGGQKLKAADFKLEGDWSSAAPFLVAGAVFGKASVEGLDTSSLQADLTIMDVLVEAGASISQIEADYIADDATHKAGEHCGAVEVSKAPLNAFDFDLNNAPDLFPVVAVLACFCSGESHIGGVGRLSSKESDRAAAILGMLHDMGVEASVDGDIMTITGHSVASRQLNGNLLKGGSFTSYHDHRMVMALKLASLGADSEVVIDDVQCLGKSFPEFLEKFGK